MTSSFLEQKIKEINNSERKRTLRQVDGPQDAVLDVNGKRVLNFCSNNYLGLANDQRLVDAAVSCMQTEGFGSGASRLVCGNLRAHTALEETLADFKQTERCLLYSTGYMANVGMIAGLFGREDMIFSDRLNHASIVDGIMLSQAQYKRYPHVDMAALEDLLRRFPGGKKRVIITDSVFSMDGDIAPLHDIVALAKKYHCMVMIDEAHAFGVLGARGRGAAELYGVSAEVDIQMGTLSKAAGAFGAYCCGTKNLIDVLVNTSRSFIYTTGMPPSVAAASRRAVEIIRDEPIRRETLWRHTRFLCAELKQAGFDIGVTQTPIIPILLKEEGVALEFSKRLYEQGILISAIRPPTVPAHTSRLRLTVMATHTDEHIAYVLKHLKEIGKELDVRY